ncbi:aquaporin Z [uncultured Brachybacterium sp.]|uniref:aquaporin Z n=1 Tax=uncultured Brachybacterium sp. TaxID=189680 RepID=UPI0026172229|nr:aquaporin Z [uncultured Brachybacterium sp.]
MNSRQESSADPLPTELSPELDNKEPSAISALVAEVLGTFLLVFGGVGTALFASDFGTGDNGSSLGVGFVGVALAFGLTVVVGAYAFGPISGGHFNPAVTIGLATAGSFEWGKVPGYIVAQVIGGVLGSSLLALIGAFGPDGWLSAARAGGFASNGFGELSPGGFGLGAAILIEVILTTVFLLVILGVTHPERGTTFAGLAIGLTLTLIHLISIPVDNTSVNPARSIAAAVFGGGGPLLQLWVFIVFPILGGVIAGLLHKHVLAGRR